LNLFVWMDFPALCSARRFLKSALLPM